MESLCCVLEQDTLSTARKTRPDMTEKVLTGKGKNQTKQTSNTFLAIKLLDVVCIYHANKS